MTRFNFFSAPSFYSNDIASFFFIVVSFVVSFCRLLVKEIVYSITYLVVLMAEIATGRKRSTASSMHLAHFFLLVLLSLFVGCRCSAADSNDTGLLDNLSTTFSRSHSASASPTSSQSRTHPTKSANATPSGSSYTKSPALSPSPSVSPSLTLTTHNCSALGDMASCTLRPLLNCGWDVVGGGCMSCTNATSCSGGCYLSPVSGECVSKGPPCRLAGSNASKCFESTYASQPCIWLQSSFEYTCTSCAAFENTIAPCPRFDCYQPSDGIDLSCTSYSVVCEQRGNAEDCADMSNCYWHGGRCHWCGEYRTEAACGAARKHCIWDPDTLHCIFAASVTVALPDPVLLGDDGSMSASTTVVVVVVSVAVVVLFLGTLIAWRSYKFRRGRRFVSGGLDSRSNFSTRPPTSAAGQQKVGHIRMISVEDAVTATATRDDRLAVGLEVSEDLDAEELQQKERLQAKVVRLIRKKRYRQTKLIGRGANGSVYHCVLDNGLIIAVKEILFTPASHEELEATMSEVALVSSLRHPNIVEYYTCTYEPADMRFSIFMELVSNGSLGDLVRSSPAPIPDSLARVYCKQITSALAYIHSRGIAHRDLKCDNLLLSSDGHLKLCDFGAAKHIGTQHSIGAQTMIGTPFFMAPEILGSTASPTDALTDSGHHQVPHARPSTAFTNASLPSQADDADGSQTSTIVIRREEGGPLSLPHASTRASSPVSAAGGATTNDRTADDTRYGKRCDVWSLGISVLEMLNRGIAPWPVQNVGATMLHIASPNGIPIYPSHLTPLARNFVECCCVRDPTKRWTSAELLKHPWLDGDCADGDDGVPVFVADADAQHRRESGDDAAPIVVDSQGRGGGNGPSGSDDNAHSWSSDVTNQRADTSQPIL